MSALNELRRHLRPGQVYRRADLAQWSNAVDRHLKQLVKEGALQKVYHGVYACFKKTSFGKAAPEDYKLIEAFLKTDNFLLLSPNIYNVLGVGTTQLYSQQIVYNRKRHGKFKLGNRKTLLPQRAFERIPIGRLGKQYRRIGRGTGCCSGAH